MSSLTYLNFLTNVRNWAINMGNTGLSVLRILTMTRRQTGITALQKANTNTQCIILGNGPTLRQTLQTHLDVLSNTATFAVNGFALSPYFKVIKPTYYVLVAPEFYLPNVTPLHQQSRKNIFEQISQQTTWQMTVVINALGKNSEVIKQAFASNKNIKLTFINLTPIEGFDWFKFYCYKHNLGSVRPYNVLLPSILLALNLGFKNIKITGADHSWHEEVRIDPKTNEMTVNHEHFYDPGQSRENMYQLSGQKYYIHDFWRKIYLAFAGYHQLKQYANYQNATITNCSERSYIDAFERGTL